MKLASISSSGEAFCHCCNWQEKPPSYRLSKGKKEEIPLEVKRELMEKLILAHLRDSHDRLMLTKDMVELKGEDGVRIDYHGRRPERSLLKLMTRNSQKIWRG